MAHLFSDCPHLLNILLISDQLHKSLVFNFKNLKNKQKIRKLVLSLNKGVMSVDYFEKVFKLLPTPGIISIVDGNDFRVVEINVA